MAIRKKTETIHLRVKPISKAKLEGIANFTGQTSTQILEELIDEASAKIFVEVEDFINTEKLEGGQLALEAALEAAHVDRDTVLTKLRTYYIVKNALSLRDRIIASTIIGCNDLFFGKDEIFAIDDEIVNRDFISKTPRLNLHEVLRKMPTLEEYAAFREKNPNYKSTYQDFLKMIGEE